MSDFAGNSAKLAVDCIRNSHFRDQYTKLAKQTSEAILEEARHAETLSQCQQREIWEGASRKACYIRNDSLRKTRQQISITALNFSKIIKDKTPSFHELTKKYSKRLFGDFVTADEYGLPYLNPNREKRMFEAIIRASGRTNSIINIVSRIFGFVGYLTMLLTICFVLYNVSTSKNHTAFIINCCVTVCGGVIGSHFGSVFGSYVGRYLGYGNVTVFVISITVGICGGVTMAIVCDVSMTTILCKVFNYDKPSAVF